MNINVSCTFKNPIMNIELREIKKVLPKKNTIKIIETVYSSTYTFLLHVLQYIVMQLNVAASK